MFGLPMPTLLLAAALGLSLFANAGLTHAYLGARDDRTQAVADRDSARSAATACSDSVEALGDLARDRAKQAKVDVDAAKVRAATAEERARRILNAPQKVPGNVCASAQAEVDEELASRGKP